MSLTKRKIPLAFMPLYLSIESSQLRQLMRSRRIERSGQRGRNNPFRYFPKGVLTAPVSSLKRRRYSA
jgi:hypothetical protein